MKTGLESLDVGAPEITYSGNQGPKSPQEDQQKMQEFQMAQLEEEYDAYVDDMMEQGIEPMSMQQFLEQVAAEAQMSSNEEGIGSMMQEPRTMAANGGSMDFKMQGGVKNYLGEQETVSDVPLKWQSGPDKPDTELAYITKAEKDLLLKKDIHGSLQNGPNMGPGGIMSLDSFGDIGGGQSGAQYDSGQGSGSQSQADSNAGNMGGGSQQDQQDQQEALDKVKEEQEKKYQEYLKSEEAKKKADAKAAQDKKEAEEKEAKETKQTKSFFQKIADLRTKTAKMTLAKSLNKKYGFDFDPKNPNFLEQITDATQDINNPAFDMGLYGMSGADLAVGKKQAEVFGQDNISQDDFEQAYRPYSEMYIDGEYQDEVVPRFTNTGGDGGGGQTNTGGGDGDDDDDTDTAIPTDPVTGQYSNQYLIPGGSNFYSNLPSNMFNQNTNMLTLADGGIANLRQGAAFGGMMGDDGRRAYGLGSFFKSITKPFKKAFRGFKKIAKSPLGKMALMYFGGNMLQGNALFGNPLTGNVTNKLGSMFSGSGPQANLEGFSKLGESFKKIAKPSGNFLTKAMGFAEKHPFAAISGISGLSGAYTAYLNNKREDESMEDYNRRLEIERGNFAAIPTGPVQFAADGGRMGFMNGGDDDDDDDNIFFRGSARSDLAKAMFNPRMKRAMGGSTGMPPVTMVSEGQNSKSFSDDESMNMNQGPTMQSQMPIRPPMMDPRMMDPRMMQQQGGMNPMMGNRMMAAMGGLMNLSGRMGYAEGGDEGELLDMGGLEKDYRNDGGFVPMGEYERKDDVPARLSKNEFVFTADAVRNAGGGDIDRGAEIMENMMKNLEDGGQVSQESQGLSGAREMFATQQRLGEVL